MLTKNLHNTLTQQNTWFTKRLSVSGDCPILSLWHPILSETPKHSLYTYLVITYLLCWSHNNCCHFKEHNVSWHFLDFHSCYHCICNSLMPIFPLLRYFKEARNDPTFSTFITHTWYQMPEIWELLKNYLIHEKCGDHLETNNETYLIKKKIFQRESQTYRNFMIIPWYQK
jgi:hypothetical protein